MQNKDISVSVVTPLYKGKKYIPVLLDMIKTTAAHLKSHTNFKNIEFILINDYPDEHIILDELNDTSIPVQIFNLPKNLGIHGARIEGLKKAKGQYILFFDQDDYIDQVYLKSQLDHIGDCDAVICSGWYRQRRIIYTNRTHQEKATQKEFYLKSNHIISPGQVLIKRTSIPEIWMNNALKHNGADDYLLWITMLARGAKFVVNESLLYTHLEDGENNSFNWHEMSASILEIRTLLQKEKVLNESEMRIFGETCNEIINKYEWYAKIDSQLKCISKDFLTGFGHKSIAIYGMGIYGTKLCYLLKENQMKVLYGIDYDADTMEAVQQQIKIFKPDESLPAVDMIIVTAVFAFNQIKCLLKKKVDCPIISLDVFLEMVAGNE